MIVPLLLTVLASVSAAQCQEVTATTTRCTTNFGPTHVATVITVTTQPVTFINRFFVTSTTQETFTVTPTATTFTDVVNVTSTVTTTVTSTPAATTISASTGFFPIINRANPALPSATSAAIGRHRRAAFERRLPKTPAGNTSGFLMFPNGEGQSLANEFPESVGCDIIVNINSTETTIVTGLPQTETLVPATATAVSTSTFLTTETILETAAQPTSWAACQDNNVVNNVIGFDNRPIYFDRIVYSNPEGFPLANSPVINNVASPVNCCIACQKTPFCAASFYAPSMRSCHLQLTEAANNTIPGNSTLPPYPYPSSNTSLPYPTASGAPYPFGNNSIAVLPTGTGTAALGTAFSTLMPIATPISSAEEGGMSILPIAVSPSPGTFEQPGAGTCSAGSLSLYVGRAYGQSSFPPNVALYISNGPCGRMSIGFDEAAPINKNDVTPVVQRRWIGSSLV